MRLLVKLGGRPVRADQRGHRTVVRCVKLSGRPVRADRRGRRTVVRCVSLDTRVVDAPSGNLAGGGATAGLTAPPATTGRRVVHTPASSGRCHCQPLGLLGVSESSHTIHRRNTLVREATRSQDDSSFSNA